MDKETGHIGPNYYMQTRSLGHDTKDQGHDKGKGKTLGLASGEIGGKARIEKNTNGDGQGKEDKHLLQVQEQGPEWGATITGGHADDYAE